MSERFISLSEVLDRVSFSKTHLYRKINAGTFPKPVPLGPHKIAFLESEVNAWIGQRLEARAAGEGTDVRRRRAVQAVSARRIGNHKNQSSKNNVS